MQGRENTSEDLCSHRLHQLLYSSPSGYCSETGGLMRKIRELDIHQIRNFHAKSYRPENLCIAIFGKVKPSDVLKAILPIDQKILSKPKLPPFERPWVDKVIPSFTKCVTETLSFPDEDESVGALYFAYRGPLIQDHETIFQLTTLLTYLTDSPLALLNQAYVEREDVMCIEIDFEIHQYSVTSIVLNFSSVFVEYLTEIPKSLPELLKSHAVDMERMKDVIVRQKSIAYDYVESHPADSLFRPLLLDFLYGSGNGSMLRQYSNQVTNLEKQMQLPAEHWQNLLQTYFINASCAVLMAKPSATMVEQLAQDTAALIQQRVNELGPEKLHLLQKKVENAIQLNSLPIPDDMLQAFPYVPPNIVFPKVMIAQFPKKHNLTNPLQTRLNRSTPLPFTLHLSSIQSKFINISSTWNIFSSFPLHLIPYMCVYLELMFTSAVHPPNQEYMPYEKVVQGLEKDLVYYSNGCGFNGCTFSCGAYGNQLLVSMHVLRENYLKAIQWLQWVLFYPVIEWKRLAIVVKKLLGDIPQMKRDGPFMSSTFLRQAIFQDTSIYYLTSLTEQESFLTSLSSRIQDKDPSILAHFHELQRVLFREQHFRLHLTGPLETFPLPQEQDPILQPWLTFFPTTNTHEKNLSKLLPGSIPNTLASPIPTPFSQLNDLGTSPHSLNKSKLLCLSAIESSYLTCISKALPHPSHEDTPALMVASEFFVATEGLFWKQLRGPGLVYGCDLHLDFTTHHLVFSIYRSHDLVGAWTQASKLMTALDVGQLELDPTFLEAAKSSLIYSLTSSVKSSQATASTFYFQSMLQELPMDFQRHLMDLVLKVTLDQVQEVAQKYLPGLFKPQSSFLVAACNPSKSEAILNGFQSMGFPLDVVAMTDVDHEEDDDDDDEDDDDEDEERCHTA
ncbi:Presequence protease, mitochondrial [Coelomomyces lativittatus]|nr:Presequence protease, mitochondrial [Coelomomyces lativittatus]